MKKRYISFYCIILMVFCQVLLGAPVGAISDSQRSNIVNRCDTLKDNLRVMQRNDSRARVYLGRYYENILNKFMVPLNMRLVENNLSTNALIDNQNDFVRTRTNFIIDYIEYQKTLESLVATDCRTEPEKFYELLEQARVKRGIVAEDAARLKSLAVDNLELVREMRIRL